MLKQSLFDKTIIVLLAALLTRLVGVLITTLTKLNPYSLSDANHFAAAAAFTADGFRRGVYVTNPDNYQTINEWGTVLSPFWLLPGPSRVYARLAMAVIGAYAVYNVYLIAKAVASSRTALIAVVPLIFYPSFILIHSTVLREAAVLIGIVFATRLFILPSEKVPTVFNYVFAGSLLWATVILRSSNQLVFSFLLGFAAIVKYRKLLLGFKIQYFFVPVAAIGTVIALPTVERIFKGLAATRRERAEGRTVYLESFAPETIPSVLAFSWVGASYFMFTPFPWMVTKLADLVVMFEGIGNLVFAVFAIVGFRSLINRNVTIGMTFTVGVVLAAVLYGLGTANVGTAVRHRQMLLWVLFIIGSIGITDSLKSRMSKEAKT